MSNQTVNETFESAQASILARNPFFAKELLEVKKFYQFFDGYDVNDPDHEYGQVWKTSETGLDYKPTKEIRNITKRLIKKQSRFMFGKQPNLQIKPIKGNSTDSAETKRTTIDSIFADANFWGLTAQAFTDATIGKRVLLMLTFKDNKPVGFRYYTMPEFVHEVDPNDSSTLTRVTIAFQDERTRALANPGQQLWHQYIYEMRGEGDARRCWYVYQLTDGDDAQMWTRKGVDDISLYGNSAERVVELTSSITGEVEEVIVEVKEETDTGLKELPCKLIINDGLTGDIYGNSDIKDLMQMATNYNRTNSDYRDALKFRMFEQPVIIDADNESTKGLLIAPNALINLKSDRTQGLGSASGSSKQAQVTTLSSSFNFQSPADTYLTNLKRDMYEMMDQPLPEKLQEAPSAKALKYLFYDLIARCDEKWWAWEEAILWAIELICTTLPQVNTAGIYEEEQIASLSTLTINEIKHIYPIPEDEDAKREIAIREVESNVKSRQTYIRENSDVEDETKEWAEIIEENQELNETTNAGFMNTVDTELETVGTETNTNTSEGDGEDDKTIKKTTKEINTGKQQEA